MQERMFFSDMMGVDISTLLCYPSSGKWYGFGISSGATWPQTLKNYGQVYPPMHGTLQKDQPPDCINANKIPLDRSIGDLFRDYPEEYIRVYKPNMYQIKLIRAIRVCKTPVLGGRMLKCKECGKELYIYHSCGHSQCPICQNIKRAQWQDRLKNRLLQVPYVHAVFTLPKELRRLTKLNPRPIYNLLMRSAWKTVRELSADPDNIGGLPGMVSVLHTFGSDMKFHPHVHCLITFGGLNDEGKWMWPAKKKKLAPFRAICKKFREVFLKDLDKLIEKGKIKYCKEWQKTREAIENKRWNVKNTYPTMDTSLVENYLSRYINRVAISRNRLEYIESQQKVRLTYNNYRKQEKNKVAPKAVKILHPLVAIDQILVHLLPPYFQKSRYYGLHATITYKRMKDKVPESIIRSKKTIRTVFEILYQILKIPPYECKKCGSPDYEIKRVKPDKKWKETFLSFSPARAPPLLV